MTAARRIGVLVLAAGFSRRFGSDKRLHPVAGVPLLQRTLEAVRSAGLEGRVCIRPNDRVVRDMVAAGGYAVVDCDRAGEGMASTLAQGVSACDDWEGLLVALADMACIAPASYRRIAQVLRAGSIVRPCYHGKPGNPVAFDRAFFPELARLRGDGGGRALLQRHPAQILPLELEDRGILRDLDRPEPR